MTWFKVDDSFYDHPKVFDAPDCAVALWVRAGTWSARSLTDGFVPAKLPGRLCDDPDTAVQELLERGLWIETKGGYQFHDWAEYQPSKTEVLAARQKKSSGGRIGNHRRWHIDRGVTDPGCEYCQTPPSSDNRSDTDRTNRSHTESLANRPSRPVPTRPDRDGSTPGDDQQRNQSVHARARTREALRWLSQNYGLTDTEAANAWETAEARARNKINNPVRYLQRMAERGHLADIVGAIQTAAAPEPVPEPEAEAPAEPEPPPLHALEGTGRSSDTPTQSPLLHAIPTHEGQDDQAPLYDREAGEDRRTAAPLLAELKQKWNTGT